MKTSEYTTEWYKENGKGFGGTTNSLEVTNNWIKNEITFRELSPIKDSFESVSHLLTY